MCRNTSWKDFDRARYGKVLDGAFARGKRLYSAAYIMPSPPFGSPRKHQNHLDLLKRMMRDGTPTRIARARSLRAVFELFRSYPSLGDFLAFQFAIDLNYSEMIDFSEMEFVVAGPGARDGIRKCFSNAETIADSEIIEYVAHIAQSEFERLELVFHQLGGLRPLQLVDCQNLFCEVDKYARVVHPEYCGASGRTRIKQRFSVNAEPLPQFYPPKWKLPAAQPASAVTVTRNVQQTAILFDAPAAEN